MRNLFSMIGLFMAIQFGMAQTDLNYYLPKDQNYDISIPTPKQVLGYQVGEWMVSHDQLVHYMQEIAKKSDRAIIQEYARSYENRPLLHLIFSSPENLAKLDQIKAEHQKLCEPGPSADIKTKNMPLIVILAYTIHGNEASGANASLLTAYYLAAARGPAMDELLKNTIIIIDPTLNPDGMNRFAEWTNMHKSYAPLMDPNSRVFHEVYPGGRTNHYWFDLNRDYLLLTNPESIGRVEFMQEWKPNIVTDHHEMGSNSTFFFQPGVPSRNNPLTPQRNYELTKAIANYHAKFLDQIGSQYFSEENFDDYYFGKGSSYPDINSGIGILFEQASSRGFLRKTSNGVLSFPFTIRNQFTASLSTLEAAKNLRKPLLDYQKEFYISALKQADKDPIAGWLFGDATDLGKTRAFLNILKTQHIQIKKLTQDYRFKGKLFPQQNTYYIQAKQNNYRLIKSIFENTNTFKDKTFYDVSTWNFFAAFNMPNVELRKGKKLILPKTEILKDIPQKKGQILGSKTAVAYAFRWTDYYAPKLLAAMQSKGLRTKVAKNPFTYQADNLNVSFGYGTILIPATDQILNKSDLHKFMSKIAKENGINIYSFSTSLTPNGSDLGSNSFAALKQPKVLIFVGGHASSRDAGEIWHLFDQRYNMPVSLVEQKMINRIKLSEYSTIVLPGGNFNDLKKNGIEKLKLWIKNGGNLIAYKTAIQWVSKNLDLKMKFKPAVKIATNGIPSYKDRRADANIQDISGAIFEVNFDPSHPLAFGLEGSKISVFKTGTQIAEMPENKYASPFVYAKSPLLSGYCSKENIERISNSPFIITQSYGKGHIIALLDNTNFRGFWYGTNKIFANAVFFGSVL